jgi:hypothetical protein
LIEHEQSARQITVSNAVSFNISFELALIFNTSQFRILLYNKQVNISRTEKGEPLQLSPFDYHYAVLPV